MNAYFSNPAKQGSRPEDHHGNCVPAPTGPFYIHIHTSFPKRAIKFCLCLLVHFISPKTFYLNCSSALLFLFPLGVLFFKLSPTTLSKHAHIVEKVNAVEDKVYRDKFKYIITTYKNSQMGYR